MPLRLRLARHLNVMFFTLCLALATSTPRAEADPPGGTFSTLACDSCLIAPDTCCAAVPHYTFSGAPVFSSHILVGTREPFGTVPYAVTVYDLGSPPPSPLEDTNWAGMTRYNGPSNTWNQDSLGSVFGLTVDPFGNIFVTQSSAYFFDYLAQVFGAAPGGIYRIDGSTGVITTFAALPNLPDPAVTPGANFPCLGNITYDCRRAQFFVTNLEDGKIYRLKPVGVNGPTGTIVQVYDPLTPDNGAPGWAPLGERLWGIQWHGDRVYYSVWAEDAGSPSATVSNEIRSVGLLGGGAINPASDRHELFLPPMPAKIYSNPVSDISFSASGNMLLGERGITGKTNYVTSDARVFEAKCQAGCWTPASSFAVGYPGNPFHGAGGVDYDPAPYTGGVLGRVWSSADLMHHFLTYPDVLTGYQGLRPTGGTNVTSVLVDADGNTALTEKAFMGDVEAVGCPGPYGTMCGVKFQDTNRNGVRDSSETLLVGWTMTLSGGGGPYTATTDENGRYCFTDVPPGTYTLTEQLQPGWIQTAPASGSYVLTVAANQILLGLDFGNYSCAGSGTGCATIPPYSVAWWPFDDALASPTASDVTHLTPTFNVAQLNAAAAITASGHSGHMLCIPNELDYARVPFANQIGLSFGAGSFAIDAWVNLNPGTGNPRMLVEKRVLLSPSPYRTRGWALYFNGLQSYLELGAGVNTVIIPGPTVAASTWNQIAVSVDRTGAGRWYLNGAPMPTFDFVPIPGTVSSNADLYMGAVSPPFGSGASFDGCIDDLEIFSAPLSAANVLALYTAGVLGKCSDIVRLPALTSICSGQSSVSVCFNLCNTSATTQSYHWSLAGLPIGPGCTVSGPTSVSPGSGTATLAPGACTAPICVTIARPAGLTAQNATSCFQLTVVNDSTGVCTVRQSVIRADNTCWCVTSTTPGLVRVPGRLFPGVIGIPVAWNGHNPCGSSGLPYRIRPEYERADVPDPLLVSLNGLPPGEPVFGTLDVAPPTDAGAISVLVSLPNGYDPAAYYEIVLEADTDGDGNFERIGGVEIVATYDDGVTSVPGSRAETVALLGAAPNPFTSGATIRFTLPRADDADLAVYDAGGRLVRRLAHGALLAGAHLAEWDGRDARGHDAAVGIYFVRLRYGASAIQAKLVRLR